MLKILKIVLVKKMTIILSFASLKLTLIIFQKYFDFLKRYKICIVPKGQWTHNYGTIFFNKSRNFHYNINSLIHKKVHELLKYFGNIIFLQLFLGK